MRRRLWGSSILSWAIGVVAVVLVVIVLVASDQPATKFVAALLLISQVGQRLMSVLRWRREQRAPDRARDHGVMPPR